MRCHGGGGRWRLADRGSRPVCRSERWDGDETTRDECGVATGLQRGEERVERLERGVGNGNDAMGANERAR